MYLFFLNFCKGQESPLSSVVLVNNYCTIIVLVLVIMSVNNNSFS